MSYYREFIVQMISYKKDSFKSLINYYQNSYLPELSEYTGRSQWQHLSDVKKESEKFDLAVREFYKTGYFRSLDFSKFEIANYLRTMAIDYRQKAEDFPQNPYIKIPSLKKAVRCCLLLQRIIPELKIYSKHWLTLPKVIQINS